MDAVKRGWCTAEEAAVLLCFLQEVGSKKDRLDFEQFHKLYNHIMFEQNEASLKQTVCFKKVTFRFLNLAFRRLFFNHN